jgi:hypothetical protein
VATVAQSAAQPALETPAQAWHAYQAANPTFNAPQQGGSERAEVQQRTRLCRGRACDFCGRDSTVGQVLRWMHVAERIEKLQCDAGRMLAMSLMQSKPGCSFGSSGATSVCS